MGSMRVSNVLLKAVGRVWKTRPATEGKVLSVCGVALRDVLPLSSQVKPHLGDGPEPAPVTLLSDVADLADGRAAVVCCPSIQKVHKNCTMVR